MTSTTQPKEIPQPPLRECLYSILDVLRNVSTDNLKKAYKKQALKWHPDRNLNNTKVAEERFKQISSAYTILSDKHERAFYDCHRQSILQGSDPRKYDHMCNETNIAGTPDLMSYFSPFIFDGFDDNFIANPDSFYNIYQSIIDQIVKFEKLSLKKTPKLGNSLQSFTRLKKFYTYWKRFRTHQSFKCYSKYNLNDAKNARMRKLMIKENKKEIETHRQEWQLNVQNLIQFIQKRDPRWRLFLISCEKEKMEHEIACKKEEKELRDIMREEQLKQREKDIQQMEDLMVERDEEYDFLDDIQTFECIACQKYFKSEKTLFNHENGKKHKSQMMKLKMQIEIEDEILFDSELQSNVNENDENKINDQIKLDAMLAHQLSDVVEDENEMEENLVGNEVEVVVEIEIEEEIDPYLKEQMSLDYLMAIQMEQDFILNDAGIYCVCVFVCNL